jgi:hypothetical protein
VTGVSVFSLGVTFNYLVSLFSRQTVRQGLFRRAVFKKPLEDYFGSLGLAGILAGIAFGITSLILGLSGWEIGRLWLYLLGSAMLLLTGVQFVIYWILIRVLAEISQREVAIQKDFDY